MQLEKWLLREHMYILDEDCWAITVPNSSDSWNLHLKNCFTHLENVILLDVENEIRRKNKNKRTYSSRQLHLIIYATGQLGMILFFLSWILNTFLLPTKSSQLQTHNFKQIAKFNFLKNKTTFFLWWACNQSINIFACFKNSRYFS